MPRLIANQVRFLVGLSLMMVTMHCLQLVRFVGEAASTAPASTKRAGAADADLAPETSGEHMARALKVMSAKSAKRIREMSTNIMRYHDRFLPAAVYHVSLRHPASFPPGKTWGAGLVMAWVQKHTAVAARGREAVRGVVAALLEVVERVAPETPVLWEATVVGWSVATLVVGVRSLRAA